MATSKIESRKMVKTQTLQGSKEIPANSNGSITISAASLTGYILIGLVEIQNSHGANFPITDFKKDRVVVRNLTGTAATVTITATGLYINNQALG